MNGILLCAGDDDEYHADADTVDDDDDDNDNDKDGCLLQWNRKSR